MIKNIFLLVLIFALSFNNVQNIYSFEYNSVSQLTQIIDPLNNQTQKTYDLNRNLSAVIDALNNVTTYEYNSANELIKEIYADGGIVEYTYNELSILESLKDQNGNITTFNYDTKGRLISETDPEGNVTQYQYDKESNMTKRITANGDNINYVYDALDRAVNKTTPEQVYGFGYDIEGNLINASNAVGSLAFNYDAVGNLIQADTTYSVGVSATISYTYDNANRLATMNDSTGNTTYGYDDVNRLTSITDPSNNNFNINYDIAGRRTLVTGPGNLRKEYNYDQANRLLSLINKINGTNIESLNYEYDPIGNITQKIDHNGLHDYAYNTIYQLIEASADNEQFNYDSDGNRLNDQQYSYTKNNENQITARSDGSVYNYDNNGNMNNKNESNNNWTYTWSSENQLLTATNNTTGDFVQFQYDALGRRMSLTSSGTTTAFVYDKPDILLEYKNGVLSKHYTHGPNIDEHLVMSDVVESKSYYYHTDLLGSTIAISDEAGSVVETYTYQAYGIPTIRDSQGGIISESSIENKFLHGGREFDDLTSFYYHRARYRDPSLGIWISKDPIGFIDGLNLYKYCKNNPLNLTDPDGLLAISWKGVLGLGLTFAGAKIVYVHPVLGGGLIAVGSGLMLWDTFDSEGTIDEAEKKLREEVLNDDGSMRSNSPYTDSDGDGIADWEDEDPETPNDENEETSSDIASSCPSDSANNANTDTTITPLSAYSNYE